MWLLSKMPFLSEFITLGLFYYVKVNVPLKKSRWKWTLLKSRIRWNCFFGALFEFILLKMKVNQINEKLDFKKSPPFNQSHCKLISPDFLPERTWVRAPLSKLFSERGIAQLCMGGREHGCVFVHVHWFIFLKNQLFSFNISWITGQCWGLAKRQDIMIAVPLCYDHLQLQGQLGNTTTKLKVRAQLQWLFSDL